MAPSDKADLDLGLPVGVESAQGHRIDGLCFVRNLFRPTNGESDAADRHNSSEP